jgi:hypothetical protein
MSKIRSVFFALHLYRKPECAAFYSSLRNAVTLLKEHNIIPYYGVAYGDPYIQKARNILVSKFLSFDCDSFFFVADDLEYSAEDALRVIEAEGDVVAGAYPLKSDDLDFPVVVNRGPHGSPLVRDDGCISAKWVQTGFTRIHRNVFERIILEYPGLAYYGIKDGKRINVKHDFFPQGVKGHIWVGEDYAFCDLWRGIGGEIWIMPDITLTHYDGEIPHTGNYHEYLISLKGEL